MILYSAIFAPLLIFGILVLGLIGKSRFNFEIIENRKAAELVSEFHQDVVKFANSDGEDASAFRQLTFKSSAVEVALGLDILVSGVQVGRYMLSAAPILPLAIQEMRSNLGDHLFRSDGMKAADALQTVLFRHLGRRQQLATKLTENANSWLKCIALGWTTIAALPISVLEAFGILSKRRGESARRSLIFHFWSLLLALATISGPIVSYLSATKAVDEAVKTLLE